MPDGPPNLFDRALLVRRRDRAAKAASPLPDFLLERVAEDFSDRLSVVRRTFARAACVTAYHGLLSRALRGHPAVGEVVDVEPSARLRALCDGQAIQADEEALPFEPGSLDLIMSALSLQVVNDVPGALIQMRQALRPDGLLLAALFGGETLKELRQSWVEAEAEITGGISPRVIPFADVRDLGQLLQRTGFALPVADSDIVRVTYASPLALMAELRAMGASNMLVDRRRVPVTRRLLYRAAEIYAEKFPADGGRVVTTFEIVTLTGWVPHESQQKPLAPGSAKMRLADALKSAPAASPDSSPKDREGEE